MLITHLASASCMTLLSLSSATSRALLSMAIRSSPDYDVNNITRLKELNEGIMSYFDHRQNYGLEIEGKLKIILYKDRKTPKR